MRDKYKVREEKEKMKFSGFRLSSEIEKMIDLQKVLEERILNSRVELSLWEELGLAKKELHDSIIDLAKRKQLRQSLKTRSWLMSRQRISMRWWQRRNMPKATTCGRIGRE